MELKGLNLLGVLAAAVLWAGSLHAEAADAAALSLPAPAAWPLAEGRDDPLLAHIARTTDDAAFRAAVRAGVARDPDVRAAAAGTTEADARAREVRAALRPRIDLEIGGQRSIARGFSNDPDNVLERARPEQRLDAVLTAEQLLTDFGASRGRLSAARARAESADLRAAATASAAALEIAAAWHALAFARADAALAQALVARHRVILEAASERAQAGAGAVGDIARVEAALATAGVEASRAQADAEAAASRYARAFGVAPPTELARPAPPPSPLQAEDAIATAEAAPAVEHYRRLAVSARREAAAIRAERGPRLTAAVDSAKYDLFAGTIDHDVRARLTLRQRLYGGGGNAARADASEARVAQAEFALDRALADARRDAAIAWSDAAARGREVRTLEQGYVAARQARDLYVEQFRLARGSLLELLRAEADFHAAARALVRGLAEQDIARLRLLEIANGLAPYFGLDAG